MQNILVVEDDPEISAMLSRLMLDHGYTVTRAGDAIAADKALARGRVDLVLLDLMLPGEDGLSICRRVRATSSVPILLVSALGTETDRVVGLEMGADDYIVKPFSSRELLARVRAVLRREKLILSSHSEQETIWDFDGWRLDPGRRTLHAPDGLLVALTSGEYAMLLAFCAHARRVLSRDQLLSLLHGHDTEQFDRSVDLQVSRLRRKIEPDPKTPTLIKTVRNGGYIFTPETRLVSGDAA